MGLGSGYEESARTVGATVASGVLLMAFQVPDTVAKPMPPEPDGFVAYIAAELMKQDLVFAT